MEEFTSNNGMPIDWLSFSCFEELVFCDCLGFLKATIRDITLLDIALKKFGHTIRKQNGPGTLSYYVEMNVQKLKNMKVIEDKWNSEINKHFNTNEELLNEIDRIKALAMSEMVYCKNFAELWQDFLCKNKFNKVLDEINRREALTQKLSINQTVYSSNQKIVSNIMKCLMHLKKT